VKFHFSCPSQSEVRAEEVALRSCAYAHFISLYAATRRSAPRVLETKRRRDDSTPAAPKTVDTSQFPTTSCVPTGRPVLGVLPEGKRVASALAEAASYSCSRSRLRPQRSGRRSASRWEVYRIRRIALWGLALQYRKDTRTDLRGAHLWKIRRKRAYVQ